MRKSDVPLKERMKIAMIKHKLKYGQIAVEKQKKISRFFYLKNKERIKEKYRLNKNTDEFKTKKNMQRRSYMARWKSVIFEYLGNACVSCGFKDQRALQIDHINGDGYLENKKRNATHYKRVAISVQKGEGRYQILCANCNWIKRIEKNENAYRKN